MSFIINNYFWWLNDMENPKAITYEYAMFADFDTNLGSVFNKLPLSVPVL